MHIALYTVRCPIIIIIIIIVIIIINFESCIVIGADQSLYFWLLNLEDAYLANNNKLPETLYFQVDGGSENANKITYG
jgi:hypothetical protein